MSSSQLTLNPAKTDFYSTGYMAYTCRDEHGKNGNSISNLDNRTGHPRLWSTVLDEELSLEDDATVTLVHSFILTHLDLFNAVQ